MDALQDDVRDRIILALPQMRLNESFIVAAAALYLYDWFLTIGLEITFLWPSKLSAIKALYFIQRYMPFFDIVLLVFGFPFLQLISIETCKRSFESVAWLHLGGITISEVILTCRSIAIWGSTKRNLYIYISLLVLGCWIPFIILMEGYLQSLTFESFPYPGLYCFTSQGSHIIYLCWVLIAIYDAGVLVVIMISGIRSHVAGCPHSGLFQVVYRDGALYYLYMFSTCSAHFVTASLTAREVLTASNVIIVLTLSPDQATLLARYRVF
ncbi:hypothetical protein BDN72DRAFT_901523 [Pluteus cervinus]|uniref:Uncharacterized protein n=1 Tax=Pluteus cervinus TaxID=181527 RepID=A0ACD3AFS2_9AGAR|nr:hypothetical protein BDN72DRAFT_901523 [Pluteus cervinus]